MAVTYSDQLTDAPPRGVVPQRSGLWTTATLHFVPFSQTVTPLTQMINQTTQSFGETILKYRIHEARGRYRKVNHII